MPWWGWLLIALIAIVVLSTVLFSINRAFRRRYGISLFGGGFLLLIGIGCLVGGIFLVKSGTAAGFVLFIGTAVTVLFTLIYDFKKCGGAGILAFLLQLVFCVPSLLIIFDVLFNRGRSTIQASIEADRYERRREWKRRRQGYYDDDDYRRY